MNAPIRLLIHGASGRMGRALLRLGRADPRFEIVAAVSRSGAALEEAGATPVFDASRLRDVPRIDLAIDFSLPVAFDGIVELCRQREAGLVSGTTGLSVAQLQSFDAAAVAVPALWAANFSLGVAVLSELVRRAAEMLPGWDCDIVESHHVHKKDAPSGTALALGRQVEAGRGREPNYASLRAGDIVGEHLVQFTGLGERLELVHRAQQRDVFARGALEVAARLAGAAPGRHTIASLLLG